jgi:hypothetical protein
LKTKIRKVTVFYWLISITLVAWCFAMLYIYSWRSSWAGKIVLEETVKKEERALRDKVRILEEMAAPDHDIVEARIALAKVLFFRPVTTMVLATLLMKLTLVWRVAKLATTKTF